MDAGRREKARRRLIEEIERNARDTANWTGRKFFSESVMAAITRVPRHRFVKPEHEVAAYVNRPQSIGHGQTISQPYIVALMTDLLDLAGFERVLEIGTGSGYQAAVLAEMLPDGHVYTVEIVTALADQARVRLDDMDYQNITMRREDGYKGWPEQAPFDAIMVTAAPEHMPQVLVDQLKPGGRMAVPIGRAHDRQTLAVVSKDANGHVSVDSMLPVAFVPMVHDSK
jgi:protein-L-isoaspartate(D-aspartate) O-methyltransferase